MMMCGEANMKKIVILLSLVFITFVSTIIVRAAMPAQISISITSSYDRTNKNNAHTVPSSGVSYGDQFSIDASSLSGYNFAFWLVNNTLTELPASIVDYKLRSTMHLHAIFSKNGEHAVLFIDSNGKLISLEYVEHDGTVVAPSYVGYSKPGKSVNTVTPWLDMNGNANMSNIQSNRVYVLQYTTNLTDVTISLLNPNQSTITQNINTLVTLNANVTPFNYWKNQGTNEILSFQSTFKFTAAKSITLEAVSGTAETATNLVTISQDIELRENYDTYIGRFELLPGQEVFEYGFLVSKSSTEVNFETPDVEIVRSNALNPVTNEFIMSFSEGSYKSIRAYAVTANGTQIISSSVRTTAGGAVATDLIISEYVEGSSNNKAIELYNGTTQSIDLSAYSIFISFNGGTSTATISLSGTIESNTTFVIVNKDSNAQLLALANYVPTTSLNFNGDDAIELKKGSIIIDSIGQKGFDPGASWSSNGVNTLDMTLVRNPNVTGGRTNSGDVFDSSIEWTAHAIDTFSFLGSHTMISGVGLSSSEKAKLDLDNISLPQTVSTTDDINLDTTGENGSTIYYYSDSEELIVATNFTKMTPVLPQGSPITVVVTVRVVNGASVLTKLFEIAVGKSDAERVQLDKAALTINTSITTAGNMNLPTVGSQNSSITWESENTNIISNSGQVTLPVGGSETVKLTATISFNGIEDTKEFTVTVSDPSAVSYTVSFNTNGGSTFVDQSVQSGQKATNPGTPTRANSTFKGWYEQNLTTLFDFDSVITSNTTVFAVWETLLYSYNFSDGGSSSNSNYANTNLTTNVNYASDNPGGTLGTTAWIADYANLSLTSGTRLGGKLVSIEYGNPNSNIRTNFNFSQSISKVEIIGATTFGTASNLTNIYLQISSDNGITWTTIDSTTTKTGTIAFSNLSIPTESRIRITIALTASGTSSGLAFTGIKVYGNPS